PRRLRAGHSQSAALPALVQWAPGCHRSRRGKKKEGQLRGSGSGYLSNSGTRSPSLPKGPQSLVISIISLVISCTVSAVSGHLLYCVRSLWSSPVLCLQSIGSEYFCFCFS
ncbi:unnamed protein product, partial [Staurois parvus]